ncbi:MAG: ABC transporter permease [Burkholderiales bacterium]
MSAVAMPVRPEPVERPEFERTPLDASKIGQIERPLSVVEKLWNVQVVRNIAVVLMFVIAWELYTKIANVQPLLFPSFSDTVKALIQAFTDQKLMSKIWFTVQSLLIGYAVGLFAAAVLVSLASVWRVWSDILMTATAMFNPLPSIALLPLAMLWFGLGTASLVFILIHAVLWAVALNTFVGFQGVSHTQRMVGQNYGLRGVIFAVKILIPAALATVLSGMKIGWAFAWRTLIGAELIFGATARGGGLGWHIFENAELLNTPQVFAGLFMIILIGVVVEYVIFRTIEVRTVRRWGMQR